MSTELERRYRGLLRILPDWYRARWAEEMVATFLASMATDDPERAEYLAEYGRPSWPEVGSVLLLAVRLRLSPGTAGTPRHRAWRDAVRLLALMGLLSLASLATIGLGQLLWRAGDLPGAPATRGALAAGMSGRWLAIRVLLDFLAVPAYLALLAGRWRAARVLALLVLATMAAGVVVDLAGAEPVRLARWLALLVDAVPVAALWAVDRDAPPAARRPWLVALPVAVAVNLALVLVVRRSAGGALLRLDWPGWSCAIVTATALGCLTLAAARGARPPLPWCLSLSVLALLVLGQRLLTLPEYLSAVPVADQSAALRDGVVQLIATLAAGLPLAVLARQALHGLPAEPVPTAPAPGR